jgi:putative DNA primase/helicase
MSADVFAQFRAALAARDIIPPEPLIGDGRLRRCDAVGKRGRHDAGYVLHLDGFPCGGLQNWRDGRGWEFWRLDIGRPLTRVEREAIERRDIAARIQRAEEKGRWQAEARDRAGRIWAAARPSTAPHPYLAQKGVLSHALRVYKGALVVPLRAADGTLHSLQFIAGNGTKRFLKGGRVVGMSHLVGTVDEDEAVVCVAEGYATAASIHAATGYPVAVAFNAGNLAAVTRALRQSHPRTRLIVCADDDVDSPGNQGLTLASAAARENGALVAVPNFGAARPTGATDFNDLHHALGLDAVKASLAIASTAADDEVDTSVALEGTVADWPEPEPLGEALEGEPYPDDALPAILGDAVRQAQTFVQAPMALVACSALAALSVAVQGLVDVRRDHHLTGPVSLYLLALADSGERKTTCDAIFGAALRRWESERRKALALELAESEAALAAYDAKRSGLLDAIKLKRRREKATHSEEAALAALVKEAPTQLPVPRLLYADATPEALAHALATGWSSAGVLSAEAGAVFGAHGMGQDTLLRNLALLNVLWDGGEMAIDRRTRPSFVMRGCRLTFGLMVQPDALRSFLERAGTLPRGTGFIARFLIAWPQSTQGTRAFRPAPVAMPAVERFGAQIGALLDSTPESKERDESVRIMLDLSPTARTKWIEVHDVIEGELGRDGRLRAVRDVASKAAENVVRLAALFHVLEHGVAGTIDEQSIVAAERIVGWHLLEARRLLAELDVPPTLSAAIRLDAWLIAEARHTGATRVPVTRIYQFGPRCVRDSRDLRAALAILNERGRARMEVDGRRRYVVVNPVLLIVDS